jgi:hypothetical protein
MTSEHTPLLSGSTSDPSPPPFDSDSNLAKFRKAIGIHTQPTSDDDLESARKTAKGLYREVINKQKWRNRQYRVVEGMFYVALGAQIVIGATLASLGPNSKIHPTAITILGIVNTSIAGLLTVFKGQGIPDRFRKDEYQMKKVQDFIEEMDIRLSVDGEDTFTAQELDEVVQQVFEKYNTAIDTAEMNKPSSYAHQPEETVKGRNRSGVNTITRFTAPENGKGKGKFVID